MKLFLISQTENDNYDTYDSAVVAAPDEATARNMNPSSGLPVDWEKTNEYGTWCITVGAVIVKYLGEADSHIEQGVICSSYNAG